MSSKSKLKIFDTFAGIGGFRLALEQAIGEKNVQCIGFSEIDKFAKEVYKYHWPDTPDLGDISKIDISNLQDFDILTWGFPCQDVSLAGQQNLDNGRTVLVEYLLRILEEKQPEYFLFENVKGLLSKKFNVFFNSILNRIRKAGYDVEYKLLNSKDFGIPQNRERVFICWNLSWQDIKFPNKETLKLSVSDLLEKENNINKKYYLNDKNLKHLSRDFWAKGKNITTKKVTPTLTASMWTGGGNVPYLLTDDWKYRKITPKECERLQWYPDDWTNVPYKNRRMSMTQRYKQLGNSITVPVVKKILCDLLPLPSSFCS